MPDSAQFPLGAALTLQELENELHPALHQLRQHEPVSWVPVLNGWLVTSYDAAIAVMRNSSAALKQPKA